MVQISLIIMWLAVKVSYSLANKLICFMGLIISITCLIILLLIEINVEVSMLSFFTILALSGLLPFILHSSPVFFSPSRLFSISIFAFILARPSFNLFLDVELVTVGNNINQLNLTKTLIILTLSIWLANISYALTSIGSYVYFGDILKLRLPTANIFKNTILCFSIFSGSYFLIKSWEASKLIGLIDYFSALSDPNFHKHIKYFFIAKSLLIFWILLSREKKAVEFASRVLLFFSIGFLLIGLRGYFVAYFFLFVYFLNERIKINFLQISVGLIVFLFGSSFILEYRLGFSIYDNIFDMISSPILQQGSTFEVVFGVVNFHNEIFNCISRFEFLANIKSLGVCIDITRGVPFEEGGFASSFFAESYYLGLIFFILNSVLIGAAVRFCDFLSEISVGPTGQGPSFIAAFILFLVIPNLVYFGRSSAFDFLFKLTTACLLMVFFYKIWFRGPSKFVNRPSKFL